MVCKKPRVFKNWNKNLSIKLQATTFGFKGCFVLRGGVVDILYDKNNATIFLFFLTLQYTMSLCFCVHEFVPLCA